MANHFLQPVISMKEGSYTFSIVI